MAIYCDQITFLGWLLGPDEDCGSKSGKLLESEKATFRVSSRSELGCGLDVRHKVYLGGPKFVLKINKRVLNRRDVPKAVEYTSLILTSMAITLNRESLVCKEARDDFK